MSLTFAACGLFLAWLVWKVLDLGKAWAVFADDDTGKGGVKRVKIKDGSILERVKKGQNKSFLTHSRARYSTGRGPMFILHPLTGWNFVAPSAHEAAKEPSLAKLMISDPALYHYAIKHNESQDALNANQDKDSWIVAVAPFAVVAVFAILAVVTYLAVQLGDK